MQVTKLADETTELRTIQDRLIDTLTLQHQTALEAAAISTEALVTGAGDAGWEIATYLSKKIRDDLDAQQAFLRCRNFSDLRVLQMRYICASVGQLGDEATRLMQIGTEVATRSLERSRH